MATDDRLRVPFAEFFLDLLTVDAALHGRSPAQQASTLACEQLSENQTQIRQMVEYLASKRGLSFDDLWLQFLQGRYQKMTDEELAELRSLTSPNG